MCIGGEWKVTISHGVFTRLMAARVVVKKLYWSVPTAKGMKLLSAMTITGPTACAYQVLYRSPIWEAGMAPLGKRAV